MRTDRLEVTHMDDLDLIADLNDQDDDGLGWSTLVDATVPQRVHPGAMILAGNSQAQAVVRVVAIDAARRRQQGTRRAASKWSGSSLRAPRCRLRGSAASSPA